MSTEEENVEKAEKLKPYTPKLSPKQWAAIQVRYEMGENPEVLAKEYGIHRSTLIRHGQKHGWKLMSDVYDRAVMEARESVKLRAKTIAEERIEKANENQQKLFQFSQKFALEMLQQLYMNLEAIKHEREKEMRKLMREAKARGEENPVIKPPYRSLGKLPYEARACYDMLRDAAMSERIVIYADALEPNIDGDDSGSTDRLVDIFRSSRRVIDKDLPQLEDVDALDVDMEVEDDAEGVSFDETEAEDSL